MSAKVQIKGDTKDAQQKIQRLRKEVEKLDKEAKKPKKITVQGNNRLGKIGNVASGVGSALSVAGGNLISMLVKGMLNYIPAASRLGAGLLSKAFGLKELEGAVTRITPKIRSLTEALETFGNPGEEALSRADRLDALDDERRSHNSQSLAEEYAYSKAFSNIAGVNGAQIIDRLQSVLDMATSGNVSEMEKAWGQLAGFGVTYEDIQKGSTWQVLSKMLAAYNAAGADGENELEPAMQQIVGKRQMAAIRKIGDGTELVAQVADLTTEFNSRIQNQQALLAAAAQSEVTRAKADIESMSIPTEGQHHINDEANNQLKTAELKTGMLGNTETAGEAVKGMITDVVNAAEPALNEMKAKLVESVTGLFPSWLVGGGSNASDADTIIVNEADINVGHANPLVVEPPTEISSSGALTLLQNANTPVPPSILEPIPNVTLPRQPEVVVTALGATSPTFTLQKTEEEMNTAIRILTTEIKNNTTASNKVNETMKNLNLRTNNLTEAGSGAVFQ